MPKPVIAASKRMTCSLVHPNALESPGLALSGHFLIETGGIGRVRRKQTFQSATMRWDGEALSLRRTHRQPQAR
jgi:hypothetical protein